MRFPSLLAALVVVALAALPGAAAAADRFDIGITDPLEGGFGEQDPEGAYDAVRAANVRVVRIPVAWSNIAPTRPGNAAGHRDSKYQWAELDRRVTEITSRGMEPLLAIYAAPGWAKTTTSSGAVRPTPKIEDFATFAGAAASRYTGTNAGIPRVRYWQLWNEPNLRTYMDPSDAVKHYREMIKAAYPLVHTAVAGNRVVAGGLAPYAAFKGDIAPLRFMRELLCMSGRSKPKPSCETSVPFDVWSHHPYTTGGPNRSASRPDDASLGDLPEMRRLLRAAQRAGHVKPTGPLDFWVTEFSWDTKGPDPGGVPLSRHARWVAEAFYNMWRSDVSLAVWFQLRDNPKGTFTWGQTWQSGIYYVTESGYANARSKPFRQVLRFPFVALPASRGRASVWGRIPSGGAGSPVIERRSGKRWVRVAKLKANANGLFRSRVRASARSLLRARVDSEASVPFKVERTADKRVNPFGGEGQRAR